MIKSYWGITCDIYFNLFYHDFKIHLLAIAMKDTVGQILSGEFGEITIRQKGGEQLELGELLVSEGESKTILQVYNLLYGSQINRHSLELLSGLELEGHGADMGFMDPELRNYVLAQLKVLLTLNDSSARLAKGLPTFFSKIRRVVADDFSFLGSSENPLYVGDVRSGSKNLGIPIYLNGVDVLTHHVLIPATTGRGKSNLLRVIAYSAVDNDYCGMLILDPHDEYYRGPGNKTECGLKDHPRASEKLLHYSPDPEPGGRSLIIDYRQIKPWFFNGVLDLSDAQREAMMAFYKEDKEDWIKKILVSETYPKGVRAESVAVLARKLNLLGIGSSEDEVTCDGVFSTTAGKTTLDEISKSLESAKTVVINTSSFSGEIELLISSMVASKVFDRYKKHKETGAIRDKPAVSIVLEEAPRVLGKEVLRSGSNVFSSIAREGRKFKVGLIAITQLPSMIPREILANMNTKIILGIEMEPERSAIIESASQDLSKDSRNIASLDKGEAIISSNFAKFAIPITIPLFDKEFVSGRCKESEEENKQNTLDYSGFE